MPPGEFRLIELSPGEENDCPVGRLITGDTTSAPQYVALSYVWGPPCEEGQDPPVILLDDIAIELRPNLDLAIRALRRLDQDIHIWIDALCINQHDNTEKNMQIPLMADIYRLSDSVAVWLGETTSYGKVAFSFATWVTKHPDHVVDVAEQHLKVLIMAFFDMIRNPWFQRKWAVADVVLAKKVNLHYGKDVLPWKIMSEAVYVIRYRALDLLHLFLHKNNNADNFLDFLADFRYQGVNEFVDLRDDVQRLLSDPLETEPRIDLDELVTRTALLNASVFHDAVYSMLFLGSRRRPPSRDVERQCRVLAISRSDIFPAFQAEKTLVSSSAEVPLKPTQFSSRTPGLSDPFAFLRYLPPVDYSLPAREVCSDLVRYSIRSTRQLDIICRPWAPEASDLPSWVRPRGEHAFRVLDDNRYCRVNADSLVVLTSTYQTVYSACGKVVLLEKPQAHKIFRSKESSLVVEGFVLDVVNVVTPPAINGILPKEWRTIRGRSHTSRSALEDWFWRTLVADRDCTGLACPAWYKLASEHVLQYSDGLDLDTRRLMFESSPGIVFDFLRRVQSAIWGRRLATSSRGDVVLGPRSCEVDDLVCILHGCSVPVLLRKRGDEMGYTFVGECYVHGMMDGDANVHKEDEELPTKSFTLI